MTGTSKNQKIILTIFSLYIFCFLYFSLEDSTTFAMSALEQPLTAPRTLTTAFFLCQNKEGPYQHDLEREPHKCQSCMKKNRLPLCWCLCKIAFSHLLLCSFTVKEYSLCSFCFLYLNYNFPITQLICHTMCFLTGNGNQNSQGT